MKIKTFDQFNKKINENFDDIDDYEGRYKSDDDIANEFNDFKLIEIKFESRNISSVFSNNTHVAYLVWGFPEGDESVGGGSSETCEEVIYSIDNGSYMYSINNWYPEKTVNKMHDIISKELRRKYKKRFKGIPSNSFYKQNDID